MRITEVLEGRGRKSLGFLGSVDPVPAWPASAYPLGVSQKVLSHVKFSSPGEATTTLYPEGPLLGSKSHGPGAHLCTVHLCIPSAGDRPGPS